MQTSHEAVRELKIFAGPTTAKQQRLADQLGIAVGDEPALVTAARLTVALSEQLMLPSAEATDFQWEYITDLAGAVEESAPERPTEYSVASAWISYLMAIRSIKALERLRLEQGDIVVRVSSPRETFFVSSFSKDGRINYRGGSGARDYPHRVRVKARRTDSGSAADAAVKEANNNMEKLRHLDPNFDERRIAHLADYKVPQAASSEAIEALVVAIEEADDEKPVQKVIAKYPELLRPIAAGTLGLWAIPQKSLGDTYDADFLVGYSDSTGMHWIYVELEAPNVAPLLRSGLKSKQLRKGESQIEEWRHWIEENIHTARAAPVDGGGGLIGITSRSPGLVLIGRANSQHIKYPQVKKHLVENSGVAVHSYDWLVSVNRQNLHLGRGGAVDWEAVEDHDSERLRFDDDF